MKFNFISALKATVLWAVAFMAFPATVCAIPASPRPVFIKQPDGTFREVMLHGDERMHAITTPDGMTRLETDASGRLVAAGKFDADLFRHSSATLRRESPARIKSTNNFPAHGKQKALAIMVEYPETDKHPEGMRFQSDDPHALFNSLLNADDYSHDGATGSVRKYFLDSSCGVFDVSFDLYGPVTLKEDMSYYNKLTDGENLDVWRLVVEACEAIDDQVDFNDYDRDGDGIIDNVYIFYAGPGGATGGDPLECIWQHAADVEVISNQRFLFDGVRLNHYACSNEYRDVRDDQGRIVRQTEGIGTVCHEFSHVLGLPDLYDVTGGGSATPGVWSLMDQGCHLNDSRTPPYFSVLDRLMLEWIEPETIGDAPRTLSLRPISSNQAYRIATADPDEYFLLENRQQSGWDSELPGHGLIVWHINYVKDFWDKNQVNTSRSLSQAVIVPADGINGPMSYEGDPYPGTAKVTSLTDDNWPNMLSVTGNRTNAPISGITEAGGVVSFDICRAVTALDKVTGAMATDVTPTAFTAVWNPLPMSPGYVLNVYTVADDGTKEPVGIYADLSIVGNSVRVTGLEPQTTYMFTVRGVAGVVVGDDSDPCEVTTPEMSFSFTQPVALMPTDIGARSFTAQWEPLDGAVDYLITVADITTGDDRFATIDFTGGIEALPAGWFTTCIATMSMNGYYGTASPSLSMGADYARLQSPLLPAEVTGIEFWYRERTPSGKNSIEVGALANGDWTDIASIELNTTVSEGHTAVIDPSLLPEGTCAVRLVYRRVDKGTLAIDDVKVSYRGAEETTPLEGWIDRPADPAETRMLVDGLEPGTDYCYSVCGVDAGGKHSAQSEAVRVTTAVTGAAVNPEVSKPEVTVLADGTVSVKGCDDFAIFDLHGRLIGNRLPQRGVYILKINNTTTIKIIY